MSSETFEEFFGVIKKNKSDKTAEIINFMENSVLQIAEIVDQLDLKVTSLESTLSGLRNELQSLKGKVGSGGSGTSAPSIGGGGISVPPPPSGGGGLPPLPGMSSPSSSPGGMGGPGSQGSAPPADRPISPMMAHANLQNELKAAFKNIRSRLDEGDS